MAVTDRTYGQWCPVAVGLDLVGDRWSLLICRELMEGDQRFTDLRRALPGLAPNLLTERLRALEAEGMVTTAELPPPAARTVYRLTEHGRSVGPVLRALARFGVQHLDGEPSDAMDARRIANALLVPWRQRVDAHLRVRFDFGRPMPAGDVVDIVLDGAATRLGPAEGDPDVVVTTTPAALLAARHHPDRRLAASFVGGKRPIQQMLDVFSLAR